MLDLLARIVAFCMGLYLVVRTLSSATRSFVLPRSARDLITAGVFLGTRHLFNIGVRRAPNYEARDRIMAMYAPVSILLVPVAWLILVLIGYMGMFWGVGVEPISGAFKLSGSSLLTLGFTPADGPLQTVLAFSEAAIGLILIALLIAYLPTMSAAVSRRETAVSMTQIRAGTPPSGVEMIKRFHSLGSLDRLQDVWRDWEVWFVEVGESHTTLAPLAFFRSPQPDHSWVTASAAVLDAAALILSTIDTPHDIQADVCMWAGSGAMRRIAQYFTLPFNLSPAPTDSISISREQFDAAYNELQEANVPLVPDRDQAWRDFAGWRVNYDMALMSLCRMVLPPPAPWSSDLAMQGRQIRLLRINLRDWMR